MRSVDDRDPARFTLSQVATDLGVTLQTVHRYFPGTYDLIIPMLIEHVLAGRLDRDVMVSAERSLDDLPATLAELDAGQVLGRAVIVL